MKIEYISIEEIKPYNENAKVHKVKQIKQVADSIKRFGFAYSITRLRKCMNTFLCSPDRPFKFVGRINEDVNTYVLEAKHGSVFLTIPWVKIIQKQTQANKGGLTDIYLNYGTYVKSFYTVMINPSSVRVAEMGSKFKRIHHRVEGSYTYPMIIRESIKNK